MGETGIERSEDVGKSDTNVEKLTDQGAKMSKRYVDVAKQLVRLYRLNLDCEDVIKEFLVTAEPEDAVEVVRCKDCKYRVAESNDDWCECTGCYINPDGFCEEGEQKETGDETQD